MPKKVDRVAERARLLDACFELIAREGYAAASMRRLAKAAGVTTGALYHYFADKQEILAAMFGLLLERDAGRFEDSFAADASKQERLDALYRFYTDNRAYLQDLLRVAIEVHRHEPTPESRGQVAAAMKGYRDTVARTLEVEPLVAQLAFSVLLGSITQEMLEPGSLDLTTHQAAVTQAWDLITAAA